MIGNNQTKDERRRQERYFVNFGDYAVFTRNDLGLPGLISNISKSGMSFYYFEEENRATDTDALFDLFGLEFTMEEVPMIVIFDREVADQEHPFYQVCAYPEYENKRLRHRGIRFGELNDEQKVALERFIENLQGR